MPTFYPPSTVRERKSARPYYYDGLHLYLINSCHLFLGIGRQISTAINGGSYTVI